MYGFALQEASLPATAGQEMADLADSVTAAMPAGEYPNLARFTLQHVLQPGYDFAEEFDYGLDLVLDGLEVAARRWEWTRAGGSGPAHVGVDPRT